MKKNKRISKIYLRITFLCFSAILLSIFLTALILLGLFFTPFGEILRSEIIRSLVFTAAIYLASTILATSLLYFFSKKILAPLTELSEKSMEIAKGNFKVSVDVKSAIPELQYNLENFNFMIKELNRVETLSNDFINNVSHEFKTPLSVIRSYINIIENTDVSIEEKKIYLSKINESIDNLSSLISHILEISKLDNQQITLNRNIYRLDEQLRQCILQFSEPIENKNIELDINLEDAMILADEKMLNQVWTNILSNAIKYSFENGTISISLKQQENLIVTISDTGKGMSEETLSHIFERFYQGEKSHNQEGNGLGLSIVKKIISLHNGSIDVTSQLNQGSSFVITLPSNNE